MSNLISRLLTIQIALHSEHCEQVYHSSILLYSMTQGIANINVSQVVTPLDAGQAQLGRLTVLEGLRHLPAQGLGQHEGGQPGEEGAQAEDDRGVGAEQEDVGGQHGADPAHNHGEPHPNTWRECVLNVLMIY